MQPKRVGDLPPDRPQRIERDEGALRDEADVPPAEASQPVWGSIRDVGRVESQFCCGDGTAGESRQRARGDALARPGFAHDRDALCGLEVERDTGDNRGRAEAHSEVANAHECGHG